MLYSDIHEISISLAFSLSWAESRFYSGAVNYNKDTVDRGLFQLNSRSFPQLTEAEFFDPYISADYGLGYLRECLNTGEKEIVALAMYNAGRRRVTEMGTPLSTLNYIDAILEYRDEIDNNFNSVFLTNVIITGKEDSIPREYVSQKTK